MNRLVTGSVRTFPLLAFVGVFAMFVGICPSFADESNPPYEIVVSEEGANPLALEITVNFENGSSLIHTVQGNGTTPFENPGNGDILSISFQGQTIYKGQQVIVRVGETEVCYRIFWWWFDSGYYRMSFARDYGWS